MDAGGLRKFYQSEWHGIQFSSFAKLDDKNIADEEFYSKFYEALFQKFYSFEELDVNWRKGKERCAQMLFDITKEKNQILSIGCGIGYIEHTLSKMYIDSHFNAKITAIEPSLNVVKFLEHSDNLKILNGYFPEALQQGQVFDFAYASAIDYVFNQNELVDFLKKVKKYPIKDFMLISASFEDPHPSGLRHFYFSKKTWLKIKLGILQKKQFWGYLRTQNDYYDVFLKAGFKNITSGLLEGNVFWIRGQDD